MRVFLAGATGVIGSRLLALLLAKGHDVAGMTRTPSKATGLRAAGAEAVVCDVFDCARLIGAVNEFAPDLVIHQLTDLPDQVDRIPQYLQANNRIRSEGTRNLVSAARQAGASHVIAQSIAWRRPGLESIIREHEGLVTSVGGTVLRYGQFYGPGTFHETLKPSDPCIHIDAAAERTMEFLSGPPGVFVIAE